MKRLIILKKSELADRSILLELFIDPQLPLRGGYKEIFGDSEVDSIFSPVSAQARSPHEGRVLTAKVNGIFRFMQVLTSLRENDWNVLSSNAYAAQQATVETFYLEKVIFADNKNEISMGQEKVIDLLPAGQLTQSTNMPPAAASDAGNIPRGRPSVTEYSKPKTLQQIFQSVDGNASSQPRPPLGPAASSIVSISGGTTSKAPVQTTVQSVNNHAAHGHTSIPPAAAPAVAVTSSPAQRPSHTEMSTPVSAQPSPDAQAAAVRRSSLASSLSSLSSGDAYLFARKVAERERNSITDRNSESLSTPNSSHSKAPAAASTTPRSSKMSDEDAQAVGLQHARPVISKPRQQKTFKQFEVDEDSDDILIPARKPINGLAQPVVTEHVANRLPLTTAPRQSSASSALPTTAAAAAAVAAARAAAAAAHSTSQPSQTVPAPASSSANVPATPAATQPRQSGPAHPNPPLPPSAAAAAAVAPSVAAQSRPSVVVAPSQAVPNMTTNPQVATPPRQSTPNTSDAAAHPAPSPSHAQIKQVNQPVPSSSASSTVATEAAHQSPHASSRRPSIFGSRSSISIAQSSPLVTEPEHGSAVAAAPIAAPTTPSSSSVLDKIRRFSATSSQGTGTTTAAAAAAATGSTRSINNNSTTSASAASQPPSSRSVPATAPVPAPAVPVPTEPTSETSASTEPKKAALSFLKAPRQPSANVSAPAKTEPNPMNDKNAEYFKRLKEEEEREKAKKIEKERSMNPAELQKLKEIETQANQHESAKTAHFSKLGAAFAKVNGLSSTAPLPPSARANSASNLSTSPTVPRGSITGTSQGGRPPSQPIAPASASVNVAVNDSPATKARLVDESDDDIGVIVEDSDLDVSVGAVEVHKSPKTQRVSFSETTRDNSIGAHQASLNAVEAHANLSVSTNVSKPQIPPPPTPQTQSQPPLSVNIGNESTAAADHKLSSASSAVERGLPPPSQAVAGSANAASENASPTNPGTPVGPTRTLTKGLSFLKAPRQATSVGSANAQSANSATSPLAENSLKNAEYFKKIKEEEELAKALKQQQEAKMDAESLRKLRESENLAQQHESAKTAHYARLGSAFARKPIGR